MNINWLSLTAGCLFATLLPIGGALATNSNLQTSVTHSTLAAHHSQLVALRKKKRSKSKKVKQKVKTTATAVPNATTVAADLKPSTTAVDLAQGTPPAPPAELTPPNPSTPTEVSPPKSPDIQTPGVAKPVTTKLRGEVVFGATGTLAGEYSRNTAFGQRTRLELKTDFGSGILTTRLQAVGLGLNTKNPNPNTTAVSTPEGSLGWTDGTTTSIVGIDQLKYDFAISPQTQILVSANASAADDFADTMNPYFDGDGTDSANGSVSLFGNRPSIYFTIQGTGAAIRHKLSDTAEVSIGYLARSGNDPAAGGLFGGGYGALAQLSLQTSKNSKIGLTYIRSYNSDFGTGSTNANLGGLSNSYGLQGSVLVTPQLSLGGWAGYTQNQVGGSNRQIWNWALTAAAPDFGGKGNLAGLIVGQEPRVTASDTDPVTGTNTTDTKAGLHIEGFYQFRVNDSISITPGIIYLTAPNQDANSSGAVIGALRTTFNF
jgi:Carbohydrate-selective porin, OprB family